VWKVSGFDDLLAQPTRRRLLARLAELGRGASTDALALDLGLHPNGVRTHLRRLRDAGLVTHRRVGGARGRPRDEWAISPAAPSFGDAPQGYRPLAGWLARAIPSTPARLREIQAAGREVGRRLAPTAGAAPTQAIVDALAALGFQPQPEAPRPDRLVCRLANCPYRDAVRENRDVVCTLHRGITLGLLDVLMPAASLERFLPRDPERAGCEIEIALPDRVS
jgi:predicted ArsR family transcriptional regulator